MGKSRSYQVLDAARVIEALPESTIGGTATERVARELVPVSGPGGAPETPGGRPEAP